MATAPESPGAFGERVTPGPGGWIITGGAPVFEDPQAASPEASGEEHVTEPSEDAAGVEPVADSPEEPA